MIKKSKILERILMRLLKTNNKINNFTISSKLYPTKYFI